MHSALPYARQPPTYHLQFTAPNLQPTTPDSQDTIRNPKSAIITFRLPHSTFRIRDPQSSALSPVASALALTLFACSFILIDSIPSLFIRHYSFVISQTPQPVQVPNIIIHFFLDIKSPLSFTYSIPFKKQPIYNRKKAY